MKKLLYVFVLAIGFTGCSVESLDSTEEMLSADARAQQNTGTFVVPELICAGEPAEFIANFEQRTNNQGKPLPTTVKARISSDGGVTWLEIFEETYEGAGPKSLYWTFTDAGSYIFQYNIGTGGFSNPVSVQLTVENCGCENKLTAQLTCDETRTAHFTFTAEEGGLIVIQGGLTNGAEIISAQSNVLTRNTTHPSVKNSNSSVTRWEGTVAACDPVTVTITFTGGNGIGDWTAKRMIEGVEVKLGSTEAISCSAE